MNKFKMNFVFTILCVFFMFESYAEAALYVWTPNNTAVEVEDRDELDSGWISYLNWAYKQVYPNATSWGTSTNKYNCHSYAWYNPSIYNEYWMLNPDEYWKDRSYNAVSSVQFFDRIVYCKENGSSYFSLHSAIYWGSGYMVSKWGQGPLMSHYFTYCPYWDEAPQLQAFR